MIIPRLSFGNAQKVAVLLSTKKKIKDLGDTQDDLLKNVPVNESGQKINEDRNQNERKAFFFQTEEAPETHRPTGDE